MKISFEGLHFECSPVGISLPHGPDDDWIPCEVRVRVPNFEGAFRWDAVEGEITTFVDELEAAYRNPGERRTVRLAGLEPNVELELVFNERGQIDGRYRFRGSDGGYEPQLTGTFSSDQTFVPQLVEGFRSVLREARSEHA